MDPDTPYQKFNRVTLSLFIGVASALLCLIPANSTFAQKIGKSKNSYSKSTYSGSSIQTMHPNVQSSNSLKQAMKSLSREQNLSNDLLKYMTPLTKEAIENLLRDGDDLSVPYGLNVPLNDKLLYYDSFLSRQAFLPEWTRELIDQSGYKEHYFKLFDSDSAQELTHRVRVWERLTGSGYSLLGYSQIVDRDADEALSDFAKYLENGESSYLDDSRLSRLLERATKNVSLYTILRAAPKVPLEKIRHWLATIWDIRKEPLRNLIIKRDISHSTSLQVFIGLVKAHGKQTLRSFTSVPKHAKVFPRNGKHRLDSIPWSLSLSYLTTPPVNY